jgi:uncharacterized protein YceK
MRKFRLSILVLAGFLSGCGSIFTPEPVSIGRDRDELKQSPCACFEIRQDYGDWILPG